MKSHYSGFIFFQETWLTSQSWKHSETSVMEYPGEEGSVFRKHPDDFHYVALRNFPNSFKFFSVLCHSHLDKVQVFFHNSLQNSHVSKQAEEVYECRHQRGFETKAVPRTETGLLLHNWITAVSQTEPNRLPTISLKDC